MPDCAPRRDESNDIETFRMTRKLAEVFHFVTQLIVYLKLSYKTEFHVRLGEMMNPILPTLLESDIKFTMYIIYWLPKPFIVKPFLL